MAHSMQNPSFLKPSNVLSVKNNRDISVSLVYKIFSLDVMVLSHEIAYLLLVYFC